MLEKGLENWIKKCINNTTTVVASESSSPCVVYPCGTREISITGRNVKSESQGGMLNNHINDQFWFATDGKIPDRREGSWREQSWGGTLSNQCVSFFCWCFWGCMWSFSRILRKNTPFLISLINSMKQCQWHYFGPIHCEVHINYSNWCLPPTFGIFREENFNVVIRW